MTLKTLVYRSPFAKEVKDIEASLQYFKYLNQPTQIKGHKTVYLISPYKSGTTFLATSFDTEVVGYEPDHYLALKKLDKNFDEFFVKRMNKLNLKLECSGFWSGYIDQLSKHKIASELTYLCVLREPSSWITSVLNFWNSTYVHNVNFEYVNELFWKPKYGIDIRQAFDTDNNVNPEVLQKLINFYFDFTKKTRNLKNVYYIKIADLTESLPAIGDLINEKPVLMNSRMRKNKETKFVYRNEKLDKEYIELTLDFKLINK